MEVIPEISYRMYQKYHDVNYTKMQVPWAKE